MREKKRGAVGVLRKSRSGCRRGDRGGKVTERGTRRSELQSQSAVSRVMRTLKRRQVAGDSRAADLWPPPCSVFREYREGDFFLLSECPRARCCHDDWTTWSVHSYVFHKGFRLFFQRMRTQTRTVNREQSRYPTQCDLT